MATDGAEEAFCYLTTTGRVTGRPHEIEIWFVVVGGRFYLLSGGADSSDWVRNLRAEPRVRLRVGEQEVAATARVVDIDEAVQSRAREGLHNKYEPGYGSSLSRWSIESLLVEVAPAAPAPGETMPDEPV
jgi:deazaflavin-dependent oxidoreductase (nitroreductase family)